MDGKLRKETKWIVLFLIIFSIHLIRIYQQEQEYKHKIKVSESLIKIIEQDSNFDDTYGSSNEYINYCKTFKTQSNE